jgi:predicted transcriptional regulator
VVLENEAELHQLLSPANFEFLRAIRQDEPESTRAVAELVDRDFKKVHRILTELDALNVIDLIEEGRSKRPIVRFDEININLSLDSERTETVTA